MKKPFIIDLFSGCGGFGLGAEIAGFECKVAVDIDETLQSAYRLNFPKTHAIQADIGQLEGSAWRLLLRGERPDGVIGGPPCQGFSRIGKRSSSDPRNTLIGHFFRQVSILDPKFFVMENVEGLLDEGAVDVLLTAMQSIAPRFRVLDPVVVTATDFGAPTTRTRVIIVGYNPYDFDEISFEDLLPDGSLPKVTVKDAIADLPYPMLSSCRSNDYSWSRYPSINGSLLSEYARKARMLPPIGMGWDVAIRRLMKRESSGHEATIHSDAVAARYSAILPGKVDSVSKSPRLSWDGYCPTLRAGTGSEKGSFQAVRPLHPEEGRVITVREAARLQGFPDWFVFHNTKWTSFRMIGNSVSPKVSQYILSKIYSRLHSKALHSSGQPNTVFAA